MIHFDNWQIKKDSEIIARQYDNLSRRLDILGDFPEGWNWELLVQTKGKLDVIALSPTEGGVGVLLTASMLALGGQYAVQLRGTQGEAVRHTNVLYSVLIPESLAGGEAWPTVPSAVEQALRRLEELNAHPPVPGESGYWLLWDLEAGAYAESELPLPGGGAGTPLELTGFQADPSDPSGMTLTRQLSGELYTKIVDQHRAGLPVQLEGVYTLYPLFRLGPDEIAFSSGFDMVGGYYFLTVSKDSCTFYASQNPKSLGLGVIRELDAPVGVSTQVLNQARTFAEGFGVVKVTYDGTDYTLYPESRASSVYVFSNSRYRLTFDTQTGTATLSRTDSTTISTTRLSDSGRN